MKWVFKRQDLQKFVYKLNHVIFTHLKLWVAVPTQLQVGENLNEIP